MPDNEKAMLATLVELRKELTDLKTDRATYLKSSDINRLYGQVVEQVSELNRIRADPDLEAEYNRVDVVLDDVFQLLSLSFMTIGHNKSAAATYASLATVRRLLTHLQESMIYTDNDFAPVQSRLSEIGAILESQKDENPEVIALIKRELRICTEALKKVEAAYTHLSPELSAVLSKVVAIRRAIMNIAAKPHSTPAELKPLLKDLQEIERARLDDDGRFVTDSGQVVEDKDVGLLTGQIDDCFELIKDYEAATDRVDPALAPVYSELIHLKSSLENLLITHRWTLRETDLYSYQKKLQEIDDFRVDGKFVPRTAKKGDKSSDSCIKPDAPSADAPSDAKTNEASEVTSDFDKLSIKPSKLTGQSILLYLLRRCYAMLYKLLESSEPISEALTPLHNQLKTMRRFLLDVKRMGGLSSVRELYPYQLKLRSIDNQRVDGKFMAGDSIPEGQGMVNALLAECFDICHELQVDYENADDEEDEDDK